MACLHTGNWYCGFTTTATTTLSYCTTTQLF